MHIGEGKISNLRQYSDACVQIATVPPGLTTFLAASQNLGMSNQCASILRQIT